MEGNVEEWINCDTNDPGFKYLTDEQIAGQALDAASEDSEEEGDKTQQMISHNAALAHADRLIKYLEE